MDRKAMKPEWDAYFMKIAEDVSARFSCPRARIGAVIVSEEKHILSTGYNGAPSGEEECVDYGCILENDHCVRAVHAEINAICYAAKHGVSIKGSTLYLYDSRFEKNICLNCRLAIKSSGIVNVVMASNNGILQRILVKEW